MQREIDQLGESLRQFVAQPNYPTLVVVGTDAAIVLPHRMLAAYDRQDESAYYLLFPQPCVAADGYFAEVLKSVRAQLEAFSAELIGRSLSPPPALPLEVEDQRQPGSRRLVALIRHVGAHMPSDSPIVWALMPSELKDVAGYRALIEPLLATVDVPDWMDRHRFLLRDRADMPALSCELRESRNDRVLVLDLELDNAHVMSSLAQAAVDPALPADERMQALIQLGGIDMALGRHAEALEKYGVGFNYHSQTGNRPMQCLCLTSAGDTLRKSGDPESALERYQQSLALSVEERSPPLIRAGVHGAGLCCLDLARFEEAEGYFEHSNRLSGKLYDPYAKADALELLGAARYARGNRQGAFDAWLAGKGLAQQFGYEHRAVAILERLAAACDEQGESSRADVFRRERDALGASHEHQHGSEAST